MGDSYAAKVMLVALGGGIGSGLRYMIGGWVQRLVPMSAFPWGTLVVNVIGCLVIGVLAGLQERSVLASPTRLFLMGGVLGGLTTFSTFALESMTLAQDSEMGRALGNVTLHLGLGLIAVWVGFVIARIL